MSRNIVSSSLLITLFISTLIYSVGVSALSSLGTDFVGTTTNSDFLFYVNSTERMRITTTGYVRIGTGYLDYRPGGIGCTTGQVLSWDNTNTRWICSNDAIGISGSGLVTNYVTKWNGSAVVNSQIFDTGTGVGIGTTTPSAKFELSGGTMEIGGVGGYIDYRPNGTSCANGQILAWSGTTSRWLCSSDAQGVTGSGANNAMAKWIGNGSGATLSASTDVFESGGYVGIGVTNPLAQLHIDSGVANVSGVRFNRLNSTTPSFTGSNIAAVGVDGSGNLVAIPPGNVAVYTGLNRLTPPTPNPDTIAQTIGYDFNRYFDIPGKATFVVTDGSSSSYNGPYFKENGTSALCSVNGTYGTSPYDCATADPVTGLSASPNNSFTMTAKGTTFGYQLALGARGDAPLFARSGRYNGTQTGGLYTNDSPYQTPAPWQKVLTVPANHPEYLFVNTGLNSQLQAISGGGNTGIGSAYPDLRLIIADTTSTNRIVRVQRGTQAADGSMITGYGTPYVNIGGLENRVNSIQTIGFGYSSFSGVVRYAPAEIGFLTTSTAGNSQGSIVFANRNGTTNVAPTEMMRITSTGAVGIGTASPGAKLEVAGQVKITGGTPGLNKVLTSDAAGLATWQTPAGGAGTGWLITGNAGTVAGTNFIGTTDAIDFVVRTNSTEKIRVLSAGNVGIGTASPGAKLEVAGQVKITGGTPGLNKVLTSDAAGLATWQTPASGAGYPCTPLGGEYNSTCYGLNSLQSVTTGAANAAYGVWALYLNTSGGYNTANGAQSMYSNTSGYGNVANGYSAMFTNNVGFNNTANGHSSLYANTNGSYNTANGYMSLFSNNTGIGNSGFGYYGLGAVTSGQYNVGLGYSAGSNITTGSNNIAIGSNSVVPTATASNQVKIGDWAISYAGIQVAWTITSDKRWKSQIQDVPYGLDFINELRPVSYVRNNSPTQKEEYGFIAQDVEQVFAAHGDAKQGMLTKTDAGYLELRYNDFIAPIVRAIQEVSSTLRTHTTEIEQLRSENQILRSRLDAIEARLSK